jgi:hypothetical protein
LIRRLLIALGVLAAIALTPAAASGATRIISVYGSTTSPTCALADPCEIVHGFKDVASGGDEIVIEPGVYELGDTNVQFTDANGPLKIHGAAGALPPTITGTIWNMDLLHPSTRVSGLHLISSAPNDTPLSLTRGAVGERLVVQSGASNPGMGSCFVNNTALLRDSVCISNAMAPGGAAVQSQGCLGCFGGPETSVATIRNVTAVVNGPSGHAIRTQADGSPPGRDATLHVFNTIAYRGDVDAEAAPGAVQAKITLSHSNLGPTSTAGAAASITNDGTDQNRALQPPRLVNPPFGNFRERFGSPTIDQGTNNPANGLLDVDADRRIAGARTDIGADEFIPCVVPKLKGDTLSKAKKALNAAHCSLGRVRRKKSKRKPGRVISQKPKPATILARGAKVLVVVSKT